MTRFTVYVPYIVTLAVRGVEAEDEDDSDETPITVRWRDT